MTQTDDILNKWHKLSQSEQEAFIRKADYLIDRQYVLDTTAEELAIRIFASGEQSNDTSDN